jgi:hypothetical protein
MKRPTNIKIISGLLNLVTCLTALTILLIRQDFFGKGDTYSFIFWTIPLAVGLSISGNSITNIIRVDNVLVRLLSIVFISGLIAYGWYYFVYLILGPWINTFSFPIFYLWLIGNIAQLTFQTWQLPRPTTNESILKSLSRLIIFPVALIGTVIVVFAFSFIGSFLNRPEKEMYLIPNDFQGRFRVVYGEECGAEPAYEDGRRILEIPSNGLLIIKPKFKSGTINNEYYLVDHNGNRQKISILWNYKQRTTQSSGVLMGGSGAMTGEMSDGSFSTESPLAIRYTDFTVFNGDKTTLDSRQSMFQNKKLDSLTTATVKDCRN